VLSWLGVPNAVSYKLEMFDVFNTRVFNLNTLSNLLTWTIQPGVLTNAIPYHWTISACPEVTCTTGVVTSNPLTFTPQPVAPANIQLYDTFAGSTLDSNTWILVGSGGVSVAGNELTIGGAGQAISTQGKKTFSGDRIEITALIAAGDAGFHDTNFSLFDVLTGEYIGIGDYAGSLGTPGPMGLYALGTGGFRFTGPSRTPTRTESYEFTGVTTTQYKVMNLVIDGATLTVRRGDAINGAPGVYTESFSRTLGSSISGRTFCFKLGHYSAPPLGTGLSAKVDWIQISTSTVP
jgi:hypothetical protein